MNPLRNLDVVWSALRSVGRLRPKFPVFGLRRELKLFDLVLIGVGSTISASIFVLIAPGAAIAGKLLPISFVLGGILAFAVALIYAEVATNMPAEGADLRFIFKAFASDLWAFITSWLVILGDLACLALNLLGLAFYVRAIIPINHLVFAVVVLLAVTVANLRGVKRASLIESVVAILLLFSLAVFIGWVFSNNFGNLLPSVPVTGTGDLHVFGTILAGTALIYASFIGYEDITSIAGEVRQPHKVLPKALVFTVIITTLLYLAVSFLAVQVVPISQLKTSESPLLFLAKMSNIPTLLVTISAILAILSTVVVTLLVASRKLYALSQEGYLKNWFGKLNRWGAPAQTVIFCSAVTLVLLFTNSIKFVAYLGNSVYLVGVIATTIALVIMKRKDKSFGRWFKVPFFPLVPVLVISFSALVLVFVERGAIMYMILWAVAGGVVYFSTKLLKA
ncbi:MAG: hypothetical protein A2172_00110 [Candidatus Woykebacteria bacterium RBG_13_40_15]|uniref:Amino acid permease n=1 Tax=Candidatus Woykebacteria bacterium RBG_13_40_15 TaxID=1802593 RepID=A0A1G1W7Q6_9BACT|nr:MAG: hypothetical protein A2172_00110 [Candidatus Woykebacteria bacterium RBG_13_40_15]